MKRLSRCVHFRGIQNFCAAGIDPSTVRAPRVPPAPMATFPCLDIGHPCSTTCGARRMMDEEELAAEERAIQAAVAKMITDDAAGLCHVCQGAIKRRERVGRCEYARPCGHRLGQVGGDEP